MVKPGAWQSLSHEYNGGDVVDRKLGTLHAVHKTLSTLVDAQLPVALGAALTHATAV